MSNDEIVIPFINEGWTRENTKGFLLRDNQPSPLTSSFTDEIAEPSIGKRFSVKPYNTSLQRTHCFSYGHNKKLYVMLVFIRQSVPEF